MRATVALLACAVVGSGVLGCGVSFSAEDPPGPGTGGATSSTSSTAGGAGGDGGQGLGGDPTSGPGGSPTGMGGGGGRGGAGGSGGGEDCMPVLQESFDTLNAWSPEIYGTGGAVNANGNLVLSSADASSLVLSNQVFALTACGVAVETTQEPTNGGLSWLYLSDAVDVTYRATFVHTSDVLQARFIIDGTPNVLKQGPFDGNLHRWWRLRRTVSEILWDVSNDGQSWTLWHSEPAPVWGAGNNNISLGVTAPNGNGTTSSFDNLTVWQPIGG